MKPISSAEAEDIICSDPVLMRSVAKAIRDAGIPREHRDTARRCIAFCYSYGFLDAPQQPVGDMGGWLSTEDLIDRDTKTAFKLCENAQLVPCGFWAPLLYWGLRSAVWAALWEVLKNRLLTSGTNHDE